MWRNFIFPCLIIVGKLKISPHVKKFQMSPHDRCGKIWNSPHMACVWCRKLRHICKIYAIFMWRKNWAQKYICGEKMTINRSVKVVEFWQTPLVAKQSLQVWNFFWETGSWSTPRCSCWNFGAKQMEWIMLQICIFIWTFHRRGRFYKSTMSTM